MRVQAMAAAAVPELRDLFDDVRQRPGGGVVEAGEFEDAVLDILEKHVTFSPHINRRSWVASRLFTLSQHTANDTPPLITKCALPNSTQLNNSAYAICTPPLNFDDLMQQVFFA
jgi:hypothetical protein